MQTAITLLLYIRLVVGSDPMHALEHQKMLSCIDQKASTLDTSCSESYGDLMGGIKTVQSRQFFFAPSCLPGQYLTPDRTCKNCSAQTFQTSTSATFCRSCPEGKYSGVAATTCTTCREGYMINASGSCLACLPGTFLNSSQGVCQNCPSGTYSRTEAATSCFSCPSGYFAPPNGTSSVSCRRCFPGMLYAEPESDSCLWVPLGSLTVVIVGATSALVILFILLLMLRKLPARAQTQTMVAQTSSELAYAPGPLRPWNQTSLVNRQISPQEFQMPTAPLPRGSGLQMHSFPLIEFQDFSDVTEPFRFTNYKTFRFAKLVSGEGVSKRVTLLSLCDMQDWRLARVNSDLNRLNNLEMHDHVLDIIGVSSVLERELLLVVENLSMGTLDSLLQLADKEEDETHTKNMMQMARQICSGMHHLHCCGVIHGNLAAKHIHVESFDPTDYTKTKVKVGDYMLFEILRGAESLGGATGDTVQIATPIRWMAPEVLRTGLLSVPGDVWSFGVVLWEMWSDGDMPYQMKSDHEVREAVLQEGSTLGNPHNGGEDVNEIISSCWDRNAMARPSFEGMEREFGKLVEQ